MYLSPSFNKYQQLANFVLFISPARPTIFPETFQQILDITVFHHSILFCIYNRQNLLKTIILSLSYLKITTF